MHSKRAGQPATAQPDAAPAPGKAHAGAGLSGELGSALVEFARRLANFGLGEAEGPLLNEFVDRRRHPRLQS